MGLKVYLVVLFYKFFEKYLTLKLTKNFETCVRLFVIMAHNVHSLTAAIGLKWNWAEATLTLSGSIVEKPVLLLHILSLRNIGNTEKNTAIRKNQQENENTKIVKRFYDFFVTLIYLVRKYVENICFTKIHTKFCKTGTRLQCYRHS